MKYFSVFLLLFSPLFADIHFIRLQWNPKVCHQSCAKKLQGQFERIKGIDSITINEEEGEALLTWKLRTRFTFAPINVAMRMVGPSLRSIHIKVSGKITHDQNSVTLTSSGDGSRFLLLSEVTEVPGQAVIRSSAQNRQLPAEMRYRLIKAEDEGEIATIEGPLFQPARSPELQLIVEKMEFAEQKKPSRRRYQKNVTK